MEFKSLKNIETSFRQLRLFGIVYLCACTLLVGFSVWKAYGFAEAQRQKIYVLDEGEIADARPFAGSGTEPSRGGEGACQTFPRAVFHAFTGQGRHRRQYPTRHVPE